MKNLLYVLGIIKISNLNNDILSPLIGDAIITSTKLLTLGHLRKYLQNIFHLVAAGKINSVARVSIFNLCNFAIRFSYECIDYLVFLSAQGKTDLKGISQSVTKRDYMRYQIWMTEKINGEMREESKRTGKMNTYITFISDAQDLSIKQMAYKPGRP